MKTEKINYLIMNSDKEKVILFLHGFQMNMHTFDNIYKYLKEYMIITLDLPGFGQSSEPLKPLSVKDYTKIVYEIVNKVAKDKELTIIAHSFGGRIAVEYAYNYKVHKIILVNGKVLNNNELRFKLNNYIYKIKKYYYLLFNKQKLKKLQAKRSSKDYLLLSDVMKKTFVKVVNYNPRKKLKSIKTIVYINASINDMQVLMKENKELYKRLENSKLVCFYHSTHFIYLEEEQRFLKILERELRDDNSL